MNILKKVKGSHRRNAANATPYFWELLKNSRMISLFADVLAILSPMFEGRQYSIDKLQSNGELVDIKTGKSYTEFMNDLKRNRAIIVGTSLHNDLWWRAAVLNCRLVCYGWKRGVENVYQRAEMQGIPEFSQDMDPSSMMNTMLLDWHKTPISNRTSRQIMNLFRDHTRNPFLSRHVVITLLESTRAYNQLFFDEFLEMLSVFGKEIIYCDVQLLMVDYGCPLRNRSKFLEFLRSMPNLEYLSIHGLSLNLPDDRFGEGLIPRFEKLKMLKLGKGEPEVLTDLLRRNNHVKSLILSSTDSRDIVISDLPNLTSFQTEGSLTGDRMLEDLGSRWNLEKIQACGSVSARPAEMFRFLENNWGNTLTDVHFSVGVLDSEDLNLQLNLPNVKHLTLASTGSMLDFMLPMKNMEHLEIRRVHESSEGSQIIQRIQFFGFRDKMQESNIWEFFPKLKTIKLQDNRMYMIDARRRFQLYTNKREKYIYYGGKS